MAVRSLLTRLRRLEVASLPRPSPFERDGSLDALEAECRAGIAAGHLDPVDVPEVLLALRRWYTDGCFR